MVPISTPSAQAIAAATVHPEPLRHHVYNIGSGTGTTLRDYADMVREFVPDEIAEFIVVVSRDEQDFGAGPGESYELGHDLHVQVTEPWFRFHSLEVDDVADQVNPVGADFGEKIQEFGGSGSSRPEMYI